MDILNKYKVILWDFDGVIMDSMPTRSLGFVKTLADFPKEQVDQLLEFHNSNGGLSRYVKFRYFFEEIRKEAVSESKVMELAHKFSEIMLSLLIDEKLLIQDSVSFIKENYQNFTFHIVSGSDGKELNIICKELGLSKYFQTINGSPTAKIDLVSNLLEVYTYSHSEVALIGDSVNDKEAADLNAISFFGYNNPSLSNAQYIYQLNNKYKV
ncbi:HAD family hydrolase [Sphingobacterium multivorum]|uniref:HAD family hydrolase n=1 Tax=Sphingobacterium multivorum TaxID=28454 RepID=UPI0019616F4B|nr:HAD hydrolase-like protein [Sphingobacterium multivorum]QRQ61201.1 HAD family hydrolase [Sphingobacterium multivorum]